MSVPSEQDGGVNYQHFLPRVDRVAQAALNEQRTGGDPAQAVRDWQTVNADIDNLAPQDRHRIDNWVVPTSLLVGNYEVNPWVGPLLDQMWVH